MKKVFITLLCLSISAAVANAQDNKQAPAPAPTPAPAAAPQGPTVDPDAGSFKFKDEDNTHNFGEVPEGPLAEYDFEFDCADPACASRMVARLVVRLIDCKRHGHCDALCV